MGEWVDGWMGRREEEGGRRKWGEGKREEGEEWDDKRIWVKREKEDDGWMGEWGDGMMG